MQLNEFGRVKIEKKYDNLFAPKQMKILFALTDKDNVGVYHLLDEEAEDCCPCCGKQLDMLPWNKKIAFSLCEECDKHMPSRINIESKFDYVLSTLHNSMANVNINMDSFFVEDYR